MSSGRNSPPSAYPTDRRRASISGQFVDLFNGRAASVSGPANGVTSAYPGRITAAAAAAQQGRRLSLSTVGLSGSPTQASPFTPQTVGRADSVSSGSYAGSIDESPFEEGDAVPPPGSSFGRRLSFGARAMRDMRSPGSNGNANGNGGNGNESNPGFDFAESFRSRARSSVSAASGVPASPMMQQQQQQQRARSIATMEPPAREMPKQPRVPDAIQERMLRGDFYMD